MAHEVFVNVSDVSCMLLRESRALWQCLMVAGTVVALAVIKIEK
jgi:hypothetical protein